MATSAFSPGAAGKFNPTMGLAEIVAIANIPGETAQSNFGGPEVKFRLVDGRAWYVPPAIADEIYRARIAPRQQIEVLKVGRAKHEMRIVGLQANLSGNGAALTTPQPEALRRTEEQANYTSPNNTPAPATIAPTTTTGGKLLAAYMLSIDTLLESQTYAKRKGLELAITCEDVRCLAATIYIDSKGGSR